MYHFVNRERYIQPWTVCSCGHAGLWQPEGQSRSCGMKLNAALSTVSRLCVCSRHSVHPPLSFIVLFVFIFVCLIRLFFPKRERPTKRWIKPSEIRNWSKSCSIYHIIYLFIFRCKLRPKAIKDPYIKTIRATEGLYLSNMPPELQWHQWM